MATTLQSPSGDDKSLFGHPALALPTFRPPRQESSEVHVPVASGMESGLHSMRTSPRARRYLTAPPASLPFPTGPATFGGPMTTRQWEPDRIDIKGA